MIFRAIALSLIAAAAMAGPRTRDLTNDKSAIQAIFAAHDKLAPGLDEYMRSVADDILLMPNGGKIVEGKAAYRQHVMDFYASGSIQIRHEIVEVHSFLEVVIARGRAVGTFTPPGGGATHSFQTHNLFVFRRLENGELRVWQIIFNDAPRSS